MPNVDLDVVNFHRPPLGTFHSKFMIVDRQIATVSSNNIQDNDNLEMMTHIEGLIVDSVSARVTHLLEKASHRCSSTSLMNFCHPADLGDVSNQLA